MYAIRKFKNKFLELPINFIVIIKELFFQFKKHWIECILVFILSIDLWVWFSTHVNGLIGFAVDGLFYMHLAIVRDTLVGRSVHIYSMIPFFYLFKNLITAVNVYSSLILSLIFLFTYIIARYLSKSILVGIIAVVLLWAQPFWATFAGEPLADYTITMFILLAVIFYLISVQNERYRKIGLIALGIIIYLAFQSKEVNSTMLVVLLLGIGFSPDQTFSLKRWLKDVLLITTGIVIGVVFLMVFDYVITHDALKSLQISGWNKHFASVTIPDDPETRKLLPHLFIDINRFKQLASEWGSLTAFLLYLIAIRFWDKYSKPQRIIWFIPLTQIMIWAVVMSFASMGASLRHFFPAIPIICIWAAQIFSPQHQYTLREKISTLISILVTGFLVFLYYNYRFALVAHFGWTEEKAVETIFNPLLLAGLIFSIMIIGYYINSRFVKPMLIIIPLFCLMAIIIPPSIKTRDYIDQGRLQPRRDMFYPLDTFSKQLNYTPPMNLFISGNIYTNYYHFLPLAYMSSWVVETRLRLRPNQFKLTQGDMEKYYTSYDDYTYSFLTTDDWDRLPPLIQQEIKKDHKIKADPKNRIILISPLR